MTENKLRTGHRGLFPHLLEVIAKLGAIARQVQSRLST
jgi:hypothetical protein